MPNGKNYIDPQDWLPGDTIQVSSQHTVGPDGEIEIGIASLRAVRYELIDRPTLPQFRSEA